MSFKQKFNDGLKSLLSALPNSRSASAANEVVSTKIPDNQLRAIFKSGLGNKIIRIKNGYALKEALQFEDSIQKTFFEKRLRKPVKKAGSFMLGFGRGIVVINEIGADLSTPMRSTPERFKLDVFSGDMVTPLNPSMDLANLRYMKPEFYVVRGHQFHHTRVVDFSYVEPPEVDLPHYNYGGMAEFELIYNQIINDGVVERASASIIEKNSTMFYKVKGFKEALQSKNEADILSFYSLTEKARSIYGAGLIDSEDDVVSINQTLTNLSEGDQITLRRLALVTGIPLAILVGESVRGLNATGDTEKQIFNEMIETLQQDYYLDPINELMNKLGFDDVTFSDSQNITPTEKVEFDGKAIDNAKKLFEMGEDFNKYLIDRGVVEKDNFAEMFGIAEYEDIPDEDINAGGTSEDEPIENQKPDEGIDPSASLNGAQVTAMIDIMGKISTGEITKKTAVKLMASAFPLSIAQAESLLEDIKEKEPEDGTEDS